MPDMKTIAIDCRFAATMSGLGRYTRELVIELLRRSADDIHYVLLVRSADEEWIPAHTSHFHVLVANFPHYSIAEQLSLPSIIWHSGADLLFSPHFNVPLQCQVPFVVTIHDLILHRYPNNAGFIKRMAYRKLVACVVKNSRHIIAISNFVKGEIEQEYGKEIAKKLSVVHEGVSPIYRPVPSFVHKHIREKYQLTRPYFLYVGNAKQHKNVRLLLDAFVQAGFTGHDLILVTGGKESHEIHPVPPHVRILRQIPDADMPALYGAADAFLTASVYEGFCLPVAEALACGCPVIAANRSVIPEIAADHATLIEPTVDAFAAALQQQYSPLPSYIVGDWEKVALETETVLRDVLSSL